MTDKEYIRYELSKAMPNSPETTTVRIKASSEAGQSHWVNIPVDAYRRMITAACTSEESQLQALYEKLCGMSMDVMLVHGAEVTQGLALAIKEIHVLLPEES